MQNYQSILTYLLAAMLFNAEICLFKHISSILKHKGLVLSLYLPNKSQNHENQD
jgi:hypothetical protein